MIATGTLHLCGIAFGLLTRYKVGRYAVQAMGLAMTALGVAFLTGYA